MGYNIDQQSGNIFGLESVQFVKSISDYAKNDLKSQKDPAYSSSYLIGKFILVIKKGLFTSKTDISSLKIQTFTNQLSFPRLQMLKLHMIKGQLIIKPFGGHSMMNINTMM